MQKNAKMKENANQGSTVTGWDITGTGGRCYNLDDMMSGSGAGSAITLSNTLNINPNADEIAGVQYQSIANAIAYIGAQTTVPSDTNRWGLMVSGTLAENIDLGNMSYIHIIGTGWGSTLLAGTIDNSNVAGWKHYTLNSENVGMIPWVIYNCTISNLSLTYPTASAFYYCKITGGTAINQSGMVIDGGIITGGNLDVNIGCFNNCLITGGTFGDANTGGIFMSNMKIFGGTFNVQKVTALNSNFLSLYNIVISGGNYYNCTFANPEMNFTNSNQYVFYSCATVPSFDMTGGNGYTGGSVSLYNSIYSGINIGAGNTLATSNSYCMNNYVTVNGGTWTQFDDITGGTINGATIGQTTPENGTFTNLLASSSLAVPDKTPVNAVAATGILTASAAPADGDTVTIDTVTYTFRTALTPAEGEVLIGGTAATALTNLQSAINHTGNPGTDYSCAAAHPTVTATANTATTQAVAADTKGTSGDSIVTTAVSSNLSWGAATLASGVDGSLGKANEICADNAYLYYCCAANTVADANWRRIAIGAAY